MEFIDQIGHKVEIAASPYRIISVVPSQTELLHDLGLDDKVVGITKFCIHPKDWFQNKSRVGGTKKLRMDKIKALKPDLIIANKEENTKEDIQTLQKEYPVWTSDISNLEESIAMILSVGEITGTADNALSMVDKIKKRFHRLEKSPKTNFSVLYLIWKDPYMTVGKDTFIDNMLTSCGFINCMFNSDRYPTINRQTIKELSPDFVFLSSEPFPFSEKHIMEIKELCPRSDVILVDGEMFSWYGSRLLYSADYFIDLIKKMA